MSTSHGYICRIGASSHVKFVNYTDVNSRFLGGHVTLKQESLSACINITK